MVTSRTHGRNVNTAFEARTWIRVRSVSLRGPQKVVDMAVTAPPALFPRGKPPPKPKPAGESPAPKRLAEPDLLARPKRPRVAGTPTPAGAASRRHESILVAKCEALTFASLSEGQSLLCAVSAVEDYQVRVTLPGRLPAKASLTQVSKTYTRALRALAQGAEAGEGTEAGALLPLGELFRPGQMLLAAVSSIQRTEKGFYHVDVSFWPERVHAALGPAALLVPGTVLQCAIQSVEDHGYILEAGLTGGRAFLPEAKARKYREQVLGGRQLVPGELVPVVVVKHEAGRVVLTAEPNKLAHASLSPEAPPSLHALLPGSTFRVQVERELTGGLQVQIPGGLSGWVTRHHLPPGVDYEKGQSLHVTVLYIMPTVNTIYLSALNHLRPGLVPVPGEDPLSQVPIGQPFKDASVVHAAPGGLLVRLPADTEARGFVPIKHITSPAAGTPMAGQYPLGTRVNCRVLQYDHLERLYVCTMDKRVLSQGVVQREQLKLGDKIRVIAREFVADRGLKVEITPTIRAFIPLLHLSDVPLKHPERKFLPGASIQCRVLDQNPERKKIYLTAKTILVQEDYPIVSTFDPEVVGQVTEGVALKVSSQGMLLELFGGIKGWVPKSEMSTETIEYPEKLFFVGQALKCQILEVKPETKTIILSLIIGGHHKPLGAKEKKVSDHLKLGLFYACEVAQVKDDGLDVAIKDKDTPVRGFVPKGHLTDHAVLADLLLQSYRVGDQIPEALCFEKDVVPILTLKPAIIEAVKSKTLPQTFEDLQKGVSLPGVVSLIKNYGLFLRLPTRRMTKNALVPMRHLADFYVEDVTELVDVHQTVYGKVIERDEAETKLTMSSKLHDVRSSNAVTSVAALASLLLDLERIKTHSEQDNLVAYHCGMTLSCEVKKATKIGVKVDVGGTPGIITATNLGDLHETVRVGDNLTAMVLHVDNEFQCLELCAIPQVVKKKVSKKALKSGVPAELAVKVSIVLVKTELGFALGMIKVGQFAGKIIHIPTRSHWNDFKGFAEKLIVGEIVRIVIKESNEQHSIGILEWQNKKTNKDHPKAKRVRTESESKATTSKRSRKESASSQNNESLDKSAHEEEAAKSEDEVEETKPARPSIAEPPQDPGWAEDFDPWTDMGTQVKRDLDQSKSTSDKSKTHLSKKEKKELDRLEAQEIAKTEQRVRDGEDGEPETVDEFDRLVLASPNSSLCWIKYMAFHMKRSEYSQAREIVSRALEKINFREDEEKLNMYMAWFNMENSIGDEEKTEEVFSKALKFNDQYRVYLQAATSHEQSGHNDKAEKLFKTLVRKFGKEVEAWQALGAFYFKQKNLKEARFTLQRSIQNLEKSHHLEITTKFAQFEFKFGEAERGKTLFETIVGNYPRRIDLWNVYVDLLIKNGENESARAVFERMIQLNLQPKRMKCIFKKYIEYEENQNNPQGVDQIRKKALDYVESKVGSQIQKALKESKLEPEESDDE